MKLSSLQKDILRLYGHRHRSGKSELLTSQEIADQLNTSRDIVNDELRKLRAIGLLNVQEGFHDSFSALITDEGLIVLDEIGPIADKD